VHLSEAASRLGVMRREAVAALGITDATVGGEEPLFFSSEGGDDSSRRLARLIAQGYAKQGISTGVSIAGAPSDAADMMSGSAGPVAGQVHNVARGGSAPLPQFLPLMPAVVSRDEDALPPPRQALLESSSAHRSQQKQPVDEVVSAARAAWEPAAEYASRRLRQLHSLTQLFPRDQRVWRALVHATLTLEVRLLS
jgi:hypothetical protein